MSGRKKRSLSRSRSRSHKKSRHDKKFEEIYERLDNLTKVVQTLVAVRTEQSPPKAPAEIKSADIETPSK